MSPALPLPPPDAKAVVAEARALQAAGDYATVIARLGKSAAAWEAAGDSRPALDAYDLLTLAYWDSGKVEDARQAALKARALADSRGLAPESARAAAYLEIIDLYKRAKALRDEKLAYADSIKAFDQAAALARKIGSPDFEAKCLRQQSVCHLSLGEAAAYRDLNRRALDMFLRMKNRRDEGVCRNNLGIYYLNIDDYSEAMAQTEAALAIARGYGGVTNVTDSLTNLSLIYTELGEFDKAAKALDEVLALDGPAGDARTLGTDLNNIGIVHRRRGLMSDDRRDFERAAAYFEQAYAKIAKSPETALKALFLNNIGSARSQLGDYPKALEAFEAGLKLAEAAGGADSRSVLLNNIGIVYARMGDLETSTGFYERAIDLALESAGKKYLWESYLELGNARRGLNRDDEAAEDYRAAIAIIEEIRATISTEDLRATYFGSDKRLDAYHNLVDLLAGGDDGPSPAQAKAAFEVMEKAKARSFLDSLEARALAGRRPDTDAALQNREKDLLNRLSQAYRKLLQPETAGDRKGPVRAEIEGIEDELESLRREIRRADPVLAGLKYPSTATLDEARAALPDASTTAIAFLIGKDGAYAFALDKSGLKVYPIPSRVSLRAQVEAYVRQISDPSSRDFAAGAALFDALVKPGLGQRTKKLIIVPDGILYYLPFEALPQGVENTAEAAATPTAAGAGRWLIQDFEVSYAPSLSSYRELRARAGRTHARGRNAVLAVGAPAYPDAAREKEAASLIAGLYPSMGPMSLALPAAALELDRIAALFPARRVTLRRGTAATEGAFKSEAGKRYRVVHLAAHGIVDDQKPLRSAVVLAPGPTPDQDGLLQTREVMDLDLGTDLAVLSACRTGLGRLLRGEGIEGLNRAFFAAGASSVLMTLWSVSDQAGAPLMERFYRRLRASDSTAAALRAAKADLIASPALSHPYYWAGYVAAGATDRPVFPDRRLFWIGLFLGAACALALIKRFFLSR